MTNNLKRQIGLLELIVYYFSTVVGVGIFVVPLFAAKIAGPASILSWLIVLCLAYPMATIFAHISQRYQVSGSIQKFIEDTWGYKFGKSVALFLVISAICGNALLCFSAARYFIEVTDLRSLNVYLLGAALIIFPIMFNLLNIGLSSKIQTVTLVIMVSLIEIIVITSIPHYNVANIEPFAPNGVSAILPAIIICFYSVTGWENVDAMAEEVEDPAKNYKKAVKIALALVALFYLSIVITVLLVLDHATIKNSNAIITTLLNASLGLHASRVGSIIAIFLLILGANAWIFGTSRVIFALARDKALPSFLTKLNHNNIPVNSVIFQIVPYFLIAFAVSVANLSEDAVVEITSLNYLMLYSLIFFSGVKAFTTLRLKALSGAAMLITCYFILHSYSVNFGVSLVILILCFFYMYFLKPSFKADS